VSVIHGVTDTVTATVVAGRGPQGFVVNSFSIKFNLANKLSNDVMVLVEQKEHPIPLLTKVMFLTENQTPSRTPCFSFETKLKPPAQTVQKWTAHSLEGN